ncbi:hypothetical protein GCM10027425_31770 [Alteromonas gracilis]
MSWRRGRRQTPEQERELLASLSLIALAVAPLCWIALAVELSTSEDAPLGLLAGALALAVAGACAGTFVQQARMAGRHPGDPRPVAFAQLTGMHTATSTVVVLGGVLLELSTGPTTVGSTIVPMLLMLSIGVIGGMAIGATMSHARRRHPAPVQYPLPAPHPIQHPHPHGVRREP